LLYIFVNEITNKHNMAKRKTPTKQINVSMSIDTDMVKLKEGLKAKAKLKKFKSVNAYLDSNIKKLAK